MARKEGNGSTQNGRDSESKRLGVRVYDGQAIDAGGIIIHQRGTRTYAGMGVGMGKDHILFALVGGHIELATRGEGRKQFVDVVPAA